MPRRVLAGLVGALTLLASCDTSTCAGVPGTCVALTVTGRNLTADGFAITLSGAMHGRRETSEPRPNITYLPQSIALHLSQPKPGPLDVAVEVLVDRVGVVGRGSTRLRLDGPGVYEATVDTARDGGTACAPASDLLGSFSFEGFENQGTVADATGTLVIAPTGPLKQVAGRLADGVGLADGGQLKVPYGLGQGDLTACLWVRPSAFSGGLDPLLWGHGFGTLALSGSTSDARCIAPAGSPVFLPANPVLPEPPCVALPQVPAALWSFICVGVTASPPTLLLRVNEHEVRESLPQARTLNELGLGAMLQAFGSVVRVEGAFDGDVDELTLWRRLLRRAELDALFNAGTGCRAR